MKSVTYFQNKYRQYTFSKGTYGKSELEKKQIVENRLHSSKFAYTLNRYHFEDMILKIIFYKNRVWKVYPGNSLATRDADINFNIILQYYKNWALNRDIKYGAFIHRISKIVDDPNLFKQIVDVLGESDYNINERKHDDY